MDERRVAAVPPHVWANVLRGAFICHVMRVAHVNKALHKAILGPRACHCARAEYDTTTDPMARSPFWAHWRAYPDPRPCLTRRCTPHLWLSICRSRVCMLRRCANAGHVACVRALLVAGVDPTCDFDLVHQVTERGRARVVARLLLDDRVWNSNYRSHAQNEAVKRGDMATLNSFLDTRRGPPDRCTLLVLIMYASDHRHVPIVERLLPLVSGHLPYMGLWHALHSSIKNRHVALLDLLLRDGRAAPQSFSQASLFTACSLGFADVASRLLQNERVDPRALDQRALIEACTRGHADVARVLLGDARVDPGAHEQWALREACAQGHADVVDALLAHAKVDPRANDHQCLRAACKRGRAEVVGITVRFLCASGLV